MRIIDSATVTHPRPWVGFGLQLNPPSLLVVNEIPYPLRCVRRSLLLPPNRGVRAVSVNVAVVGATGAVGDSMRRVLAERRFPVKSIKFLASEKSAGKTVEFAGKAYPVEPIRPEAFA